jgi:glycosyltransferase involved in cell wall biosynthesis
VGSLIIEKIMKYSFIIPALNEEDIIGKTIKSIKKQKGSFEIIVVDNGSKDKTW